MGKSILANRFVIGAAGASLVFLLAISPAFSGILYSHATATSQNSEKPPVSTWKNASVQSAALASSSICPSQAFLVGPSDPKAKLLINVSWQVKNDEDSGLSGYWGMDHFTTHLKVWLMPDNSWYALKTYTGSFSTPQGAVSPGSQAPTQNVQNETASGTLIGGYVATFNGAFVPGKNSGSLGIKDYGGTLVDILKQTYGNGQVGDQHAYDWTSVYFTGITNFNQPHWGWDYKLAGTFQYPNGSYEWCNYSGADGGNLGDIYVPPTA